MEKSFDINVGDTVWVMYNNFPQEGVVKRIWYTKFINYTDHESIIEAEFYYVYYGDRKLGQYKLNELFLTKQDLLKSL